MQETIPHLSRRADKGYTLQIYEFSQYVPNKIAIRLPCQCLHYHRIWRFRRYVLGLTFVVGFVYFHVCGGFHFLFGGGEEVEYHGQQSCFVDS